LLKQRLELKQGLADAQAEVRRLEAKRAELLANPPKPAAKTITAAQWLETHGKPTMSKSEFNKLDHKIRGTVIKTVTLVD
jgi:hypothetical protein